MLVHRLNALSDNYIFVLVDPVAGEAAVVDPAEAAPVLAALRQWHLRLVAIFNTHHHGDHVGGNRELLAAFPEAAVYASVADRGRIPGQTVALAEGDRVDFADTQARVYFVPGHTRGHIAYHFEKTGDLFCGDTLFAGGCGRLFEGTAEQMCTSLARLRNLDPATRVWCAHEYTLNNLRFALAVEPGNAALRQRFAEVTIARQHQQATIPSTIGLEQATNPFLRWESAELQALARSTEPVAVFADLRARKDRF